MNIITAVKQRNITQVIDFIAKGYPANSEQNAAIRYAAMYGFTEIVSLLLEQDCVNPSDCDNDALNQACKNGHAEVVSVLLAHDKVMAATRWRKISDAERIRATLFNSTPSNCEEENYYPLTYAVMGNHLSVVKVIVQSNKIPVFAKNSIALSLAVLSGNEDIVFQLLDSADNNRSVFMQNNQILVNAIESGNLRILEAVLGSKIGFLNLDNYYLGNALSDCLDIAVKKNNVDAFLFLLNYILEELKLEESYKQLILDIYGKCPIDFVTAILNYQNSKLNLSIKDYELDHAASNPDHSVFDCVLTSAIARRSRVKVSANTLYNFVSCNHISQFKKYFEIIFDGAIALDAQMYSCINYAAYKQRLEILEYVLNDARVDFNFGQLVDSLIKFNHSDHLKRISRDETLSPGNKKAIFDWAFKFGEVGCLQYLIHFVQDSFQDSQIDEYCRIASTSSNLEMIKVFLSSEKCGDRMRAYLYRSNTIKTFNVLKFVLNQNQFNYNAFQFSTIQTIADSVLKRKGLKRSKALLSICDQYLNALEQIQIADNDLNTPQVIALNELKLKLTQESQKIRIYIANRLAIYRDLMFFRPVKEIVSLEQAEAPTVREITKLIPDRFQSPLIPLPVEVLHKIMFNLLDDTSYSSITTISRLMPAPVLMSFVDIRVETSPKVREGGVNLDIGSDSDSDFGLERNDGLLNLPRLPFHRQLRF